MKIIKNLKKKKLYIKANSIYIKAQNLMLKHFEDNKVNFLKIDNTEAKLLIAIDLCQEAIKLDKKFKDAIILKTRIYLFMKKYDEAISSAKSMFFLEKENPEALTLLGQIYILKEDYYKGIEYCLGVINYKKRYKGIKYFKLMANDLLVMTYKKLNDKENCLTCIDRAVNGELKKYSHLNYKNKLNKLKNEIVS